MRTLVEEAESKPQPAVCLHYSLGLVVLSQMTAAKMQGLGVEGHQVDASRGWLQRCVS